MSSNRIDSVDILAVGDVFLNREDPASAFESVRDLFGEADVRVGNLEAAFAEGGEEMILTTSLIRSPPNAVDGLTAAGFDLLSFANNHAMDFGPECLCGTVDALAERGIATAGAGANREEAERPAVRSADGVRVGLVAFESTQATKKAAHQAHEDRAGMSLVTPSARYPERQVSREDEEKLTRIVADAADAVDVLLVSIHCGIVPARTPTVPQRELSRMAIDAGADAVLGTHPHILQGVEVYRSAPIFYSLGHFVFDSLVEFDLELEPGSMFPPESDATAVVRLVADEDGLSEALVYPAYIEDWNPTLPTPDTDAYEAAAEPLIDLSAREGTSLERADDHLRVSL